MTIEELVILIELRHKLKHEITDEEIQSVKPISTDPKQCYIIKSMDEFLAITF